MPLLKKLSCFVMIVVMIQTAFSSCISSKKIKYIQEEAGKTAENEKYTRKLVKYRLQCDDNVYVKFSSLEPVSNEALTIGNTQNVSQGLASKYRDVYQIDSLGYLSIPQLNKVYAKGLSIQQLKDSLELKIQRFYRDVTAQVRLADNYVTILGNVNSPGRYMVDFREQITVFELIGLAGDLSIEANRKEIRLIRNSGEETEIINLDLTKRSIIESEYYYLKPNDIVYAEPLRAMSWHQRRYPFTTTLTLVLSTAASILVLISYIK
jgi:polysaccharide biosynthesis/export protein